MGSRHPRRRALSLKGRCSSGSGIDWGPEIGPFWADSMPAKDAAMTTKRLRGSSSLMLRLAKGRSWLRCRHWVIMVNECPFFGCVSGLRCATEADFWMNPGRKSGARALGYVLECPERLS